MSDTATRAAELLKDHRASIDRLDAILVYTLAERFKHTQEVGVLKATHDLPPSDPAREEIQIARLESPYLPKNPVGVESTVAGDLELTLRGD